MMRWYAFSRPGYLNCRGSHLYRSTCTAASFTSVCSGILYPMHQDALFICLSACPAHSMHAIHQ